MDIYELRESFKSMFPDQQVEIFFDEECVEKFDLSMNGGSSHVQYDKVKVKIGDQKPSLFPIKTHRELATKESIKKALFE